ncbi:MAG: hypothetical protein ACRCYV_03530 [Aeromonas sp.]
MIKMQANISGFNGKPITLLGALDENTGILVVAKAIAQVPRVGDCVLIHCDPRADRDATFTHAHLQEAISAYFKLKGEVAIDGKAARLRFAEAAASADPAAVIESDGIDVSGARYRIAPDASNAHVASLALCRYAACAAATEDSLTLMSEIYQAKYAEIFSI